MPARTRHEYAEVSCNAGKCNNPFKNLRLHKMEGPESDLCAEHFCEVDEDSNEKMKQLQGYIEMVQQIVKPGCSPEMVEVALRSMASLVEFLSSVSSKPELVSSL
ncbi:pyrophosphate--fructose 6-phosphate 1-phosphotransferase subunit alpha 2-like [Rhodamnia argentea]|uniref:Pyrophosphate--fructose 6-phosphate 1-phosphotransferase subunit alpha 2-like n=1 Tax=Rhodamnia argentea TaxID=178133 RepID=A0A8B8R0Z0_9MYRT|nr:pyrophosphate--fructose 6-phosphate 1-phosphotransferase subunit alpha 2-like [Rhodamnia argentea]